MVVGSSALRSNLFETRGGRSIAGSVQIRNVTQLSSHDTFGSEEFVCVTRYLPWAKWK